MGDLEVAGCVGGERISKNYNWGGWRGLDPTLTNATFRVLILVLNVE